MVTDTAFWRNKNYHLPTDTVDNVDFHSVEQSTRLAAGIARVWDAAG